MDTQYNSNINVENLFCLVIIRYMCLVISFCNTDFTSKLKSGYFLRLVKASPEVHSNLYIWLSSTADECISHHTKNQLRMLVLIYRDKKIFLKNVSNTFLRWYFCCTSKRHTRSSKNAHLHTVLQITIKLLIKMIIA